MKFSKVFWAALLAVVAGSVISGLFWLITIFGMAGSMGSSKAVAVLPNTILNNLIRNHKSLSFGFPYQFLYL